MENAIVAVIGDLHVNSTVAICPPIVELDDGGYYSPSAQQAWIWECWLDYWGKILQEKDRLGYKVVTLLNGDLVDDLSHKSSQLISQNLPDQLRMTRAVLAPAIKATDEFVVTRGTEAHVGLAGGLDELIATELGAVPDPVNKTRSWYWFLGSIGGVLFDIGHHPGVGHRLPWTKGSDANKLAAVLVNRYAKLIKRNPRRRFPDIAVRGHNHNNGDSSTNHIIRVLMHPSWQLTNAFGHRLGGDWYPIGGWRVLCEGGKASVSDMFYDWPVNFPYEIL